MTHRIRADDEAASRWLESLRPSTAVFCQAEVRSPWGFRIAGRDTATFHVLTEGHAILEVEGVDEPLSLRRGDLVLLPTGAAHALRDAPSSPLPTLDAAVGSGAVEGKWVSFGGDGPVAVMVCGAFEMGAPGVRPPVAFLPPVVRHRLDEGLVGTLAREADRLASGTEAILTQLLTLVVMQALRAFLAGRPPRERRALFSPEVARAVAFIHDRFDEDVQLDDLCAAAATSRTVLSERFREALGVSPIEYLRLTRLSRAAELLRADHAGLARIARSVGYRSTSSFSRAFRRTYGVAPGEYREST